MASARGRLEPGLLQPRQQLQPQRECHEHHQHSQHLYQLPCAGWRYRGSGSCLRAWPAGRSLRPEGRPAAMAQPADQPGRPGHRAGPSEFRFRLAQCELPAARSGDGPLCGGDAQSGRAAGLSRHAGATFRARRRPGAGRGRTDRAHFRAGAFRGCPDAWWPHDGRAERAGGTGELAAHGAWRRAACRAGCSATR